MWRDEFRFENCKWNFRNREDFVICCWQSDTEILPKWILYRAVTFLYFLVSLIYTTVKGALDNPRGEEAKFLIYMSYWFYFYETVVYGFGFLLTVTEYRLQRTFRAHGLLWLDPVYAYWCMYTSAVANTAMVTGAFFLFTYDKKLFPLSVVNVIQNITNCVFMFVDFWVVAFPFRLFHIYPGLALCLMYFLFTLIYWKAGGTGVHIRPIYKWLDWDKDGYSTPAHVFYCVLGSAGAHIIYFIFYLVKIYFREAYVAQTQPVAN